MNRTRIRRHSMPGTFRGGPALAAIGVIILAVFLAGCSEDGEGIPEDGTAPTAPESPDAPETTQPPDATQPPETTQPSEDESEGIATEVLIGLGLLLLVGILAGVIIGRGRSSSDGGDEGVSDEDVGGAE